MQESFLQIRYFEKEFIKSFTKVNFIFLSNRTSSVYHWYATRMSVVCTRMSFECHSYVLVCHPHVTRMYAYVIRMSLVYGLPWTMVHGKTTDKWHRNDIRVHTSDIGMTYKYLRVTYGWHMSTYEWHTDDIREHTSDTWMTYEYIQVTYGRHTSTCAWHKESIRVHKSDIRMKYVYIRVTYGWHTSTYEQRMDDIRVHKSDTPLHTRTYKWHTDDIQAHTTDIRMAYEYIKVKHKRIQMTCEWQNIKPYKESGAFRLSYVTRLWFYHKQFIMLYITFLTSEIKFYFIKSPSI